MRILFLLLLVGHSGFISAQKIESLKTDDEVFGFVRSLDPDYKKYLKKTPFEKIKSLYPSLTDTACIDKIKQRKIKLWEKGDFDNNGFQDLLFNGEYFGSRFSIIVMGSPNDSFSIKRISSFKFEPCQLPRKIKLDDYDALEIHYWGLPFRTSYEVDAWKTDTLIYYVSNFIELPHRSDYKIIERIEFKTNQCFGTCPVFEIVIDSSKNAFYHAIGWNKQSQGKYKAVLNSYTYDNLCMLLNVIDFTRLEERYSVDWTDDQTSTLIITYDGGKTKKIIDYGKLGSYGLMQVYDYFFDLRNNQQWESAK